MGGVFTSDTDQALGRRECHVFHLLIHAIYGLGFLVAEQAFSEPGAGECVA